MLQVLLETSRKVDFFNNFMMSDPFSISDSSLDFAGYLNIGSYTAVPGNNFSLRITNQSVSQSPDNGKVTTVNKSYLITNDTIISDSVTSNAGLSEGLNKKAVGRRGEGINNSRNATYIRQNDFLDWYKKRSGDLQYMSEQEIRDIYQWEKILEFDNKEVEFYLKQSFPFDTPFEYAIIRDGKVQDGTFKASAKNDFLKSNYWVRLFPDNVLRKDIVLSVIFPERTNYVLGINSVDVGRFYDFLSFYTGNFCIESLFYYKAEKNLGDEVGFHK